MENASQVEKSTLSHWLAEADAIFTFNILPATVPAML